MKRWWALLLLALAPALHAASFRATVTHVTDGDTLWVRRSPGETPIELRLLDIDAPESCQDYGAEATTLLRSRVLHEAVLVRTMRRDDYGRQLARVQHGHEDVGGWLVTKGAAWAMRFHGRAGRFAALEVKARQARRGLWARPGAIEPRAFRQRHGSCHAAR